MQGKSKYYFPNHLLFAALANILGRANPHTIFPPILCASGVFGFCGNIKLVSHKKRNPASAHLSTLRQGSSTDRITNKEDVVKAQESGATPTGGQRKKINIPLVSLALSITPANSGT